MRNKIIEMARAEIGYKEGVNNSNKYSKELYNKAQEWCNDFVCWVMRKAGVNTDIVPAYSYVPSTAEWFSRKGQYKNSKAYGGNYTPVHGDIILFDYNRNSTSDHIGLVEKVENGKVHTIEGNKDNMVKRCLYDISSKDIRAYCVPSYSAIENKKTVEELAQEVIDNKWGNGQDRKNRLTQAGYDYNEVQNKVNEMLNCNKIIYKTVTAKSGLNIRDKASTSGKRIAGVGYNEKVEILQENVATANGYRWDKIRHKNTTGYVANIYLR